MRDLVRRMTELFDDIIIKAWITDSYVKFKLIDDCIYSWTCEDFHEHNKAKRIYKVLSSMSRELAHERMEDV